MERYILPVQLALDRAILQLSANLSFAQASALLDPLEQPFTRQNNAQQDESKRISLLRGINQLVVLAFLIGFLGVPYHLASDVSAERGSGMANLLTSLGCDQTARLLAWLAGPAAAYFPAYACMGGIVAAKLWTRTSPAIPIFGFLLEGLATASFVLFIAVFFKKSNLSAIVSTTIVLLLGIVGLLTYSDGGIGQAGMIVLGLIFPPMSLIYFFISVGLFEIAGQPANLVQRPPSESQAGVEAACAPLALLAMNLVSIVAYFLLALLVERVKFYPEPARAWLFRRRIHSAATQVDGAVSLRNLTKQYSKKADSLAVSNLSFDVRQGGLTYLLGGNGSGKSTTIGMLSGTIAPTSGEIAIFGKDRSETEPGFIGLCPQKNILFDELSATQHVRLFAQLKGSNADKAQRGKEAQMMLRDCDLGHKMRSRPGALSGGQKRKLCLAMALAGRSKLILCDEATSGLDPLSRRAIWKILLAQRHTRTVIATSHFLDEADFLADDVKLLAAPGTLLAEGAPVTMRQQIGEGTSIRVQCRDVAAAERVTADIQAISPAIARASDGGIRGAVSFAFLIPATDADTVVRALEKLEEEKGARNVLSYDASGATMESVFLKLNIAHERERGITGGVAEAFAIDHLEVDKEETLSDGRPSNFLRLSYVQFRKRCQILKRSWVAPLFAILLSILGSAVALVFLRDRDASCIRGFTEDTLPANTNLTRFGQVLVSPPNLITNAATLIPGADLSLFQGVSVQNFTSTFSPGGPWQQVQIGGVLSQGAQPTFAYIADTSGVIVPIAFLALVDNLLLAQATGSAPVRINASYQPLSDLSLSGGLGNGLKWAIVFALVQAVWPAFAALYPSNERRSGAKGMLLTNGQRALPIWIGHLLAEIPVIILATVPVALIYGLAAREQFESVGLLWVVLFIYGIAGTCQSFWISQFTPNPLAAFAIAAAWNVLAQLIFIASVLSAVTFVVTSNLLGVLLQVFYAIAIISPSISATRASWVSANIFNLLCNGRGGYSTSPARALEMFGAPILYATLWALAAFAITVLLDEGLSLPAFLQRRRRAHQDREAEAHPAGVGVARETARANEPDNGDILQVQHVTHAYGKLVAVDDVSFGMPATETFALVSGARNTCSAHANAALPVRTEWRRKINHARVHPRRDSRTKRADLDRRSQRRRASRRGALQTFFSPAARRPRR